jgi:Ca2+-binding RTX toxin-like protein
VLDVTTDYHNQDLANRLTEAFRKQTKKKAAKALFMGVSPLALAACGGGSDSSVVQTLVSGTDDNDTLPNSAANERFEGSLGDDTYSFHYGGSDTIYDTGGTDSVILRLRDDSGTDPRKSFERIGDDLHITQIDGSVLTIEGQFSGVGSVEFVDYYWEGASLGVERLGSLELGSIVGSDPQLLVGTAADEDFEYDGSAIISAWTNSGNDTVTTGSGADWLRTGSGNDTINSGAGDDHIYAGDGNDTIFAGDGDDTIDAGAGDDLIVASLGADFEDGGDGNDTLMGLGAGLTVDVTYNLMDGTSGVTGGTLESAFANIENIKIGYLWTTGEYVGSTANWTLIGTDGVNQLESTEGNDVLEGSGGSDILTGNGGADTFVFKDGEDGTDTITDFDLAEGDKIDLSSYGITTKEAAEALMSDSANGVNVTINGSLILTMTDTTVADFTAADGWLANAEVNDNTTTTPASHHSFTTRSGSYVLVAEQKTYADAAAYARSELNGTLASFETQSEFDGFYSTLQSTVDNNNLTLSTAADGGGAKYIWLGGSDSVTEGSWVWDSGVGLTYNDLWGSGALGSEPDNFENQDGLAIGMENWPAGSAAGAGYGDAGSWNDIDVSNTLYFVVEIA